MTQIVPCRLVNIETYPIISSFGSNNTSFFVLDERTEGVDLSCFEIEVVFI